MMRTIADACDKLEIVPAQSFAGNSNEKNGKEKRMKKELAKGARIVILCAIVIAMVVGTIYDYSISKYLYDASSGFGQFFAAFGSAPNYLLVVWSGVLMMTHSNPVKENAARGQKIFGAIFAIGGTAVVAYSAKKYYTDMNWAVAVIIALLVSAVTSLFVLYVVKDASYRNIIKLCVVMIIMAAAGQLIVQVVKLPWSRPRMRLISSEAGIAAGVGFQPWYRLGNELKDSMIAAGTAADDFKSFPSGHTAGAAAILALYYMAAVSPRFEKKKNLFFVIGLVWIVLTALSRIIVGAHFLTDVTVGFTVEYLVFVFVGKVMRFARQN